MITYHHKKIKLWKSSKQGIKDVIFIQKERRGGDVEWIVPHQPVVDKNWEGDLGSEGSSPTPDHSAQGSNARKINPITFVCKNQWGLE